MMKKKYIKPEIKAAIFETTDVVTTSGIDDVVNQVKAQSLKIDKKSGNEISLFKFRY